MYQSYEKNGIAIRGASGPFHTGINIYFLPKEDIEIIKKYNIFPYEQSEDGQFVRKAKEALDKEISERIVYLKEVAHQEKLLEKVKKVLKKEKERLVFPWRPKKV